jgi:serine/threonine-protein kinase
LREARSAEALEHPNIVMIYDRGIDHGRHYLVLEYVGGGDFHEYIHRNGPLSVVDAVSAVRQVADGLKYAAGNGLIHRDIKPSNILRTQTGQIKIIDLGLALQNAFEDERVTREGTTVGTVDYMAPEQARDSRATSVRSDLYSLGCTFYYLLTGVPPYPGGDITDKLTRHAKSPVPDVRDLRPDVPVGIASIIQKMMAKRPEDRFASYDDLITALGAVPLEEMERASAIAPIPLVDSRSNDSSVNEIEPSPLGKSGEYRSNGSKEGDFGVPSLAELFAEESPAEVWKRPPGRPAELAPTIPRQRQLGAEAIQPRSTDLEPLEAALPSDRANSASLWIISGALVGVAVIIVTIGLLQLFGPPGSGEHATVDTERDSNADTVSRVATVPQPSRAATNSTPNGPTGVGFDSRRSARSTRIEPEKRWEEPADNEPAVETLGASSEPAGGLALVPDWARLPVPERIDGPFVAVRRVVQPEDGGTTVRALHMALDRFIGGTVELRDEGPFFVDDLRVAGANRLIRARNGYRSIVRIGGSGVEAVRRQSAVFVLDRKNLILDGLDLIVNVHDLSPNQTSLFSCTGASLTLRNCSITVLGSPAGVAFTVFRVESSRSNPTLIRLEQTLVRGWFSDGFDLAGGGAGLVLRQSAILGGSGPLVRFSDSGDAPNHRCVFVQSLLAGPGPIFERIKTASASATMTPVLRSYQSIFGRLHGVGIASVISSLDSADRAAKQIDWAGDRNLLAGWKGFFAAGKDHLVVVPNLAAARLTWKGTDLESREILSPWPWPTELADATPSAFSPFLPDGDSVLLRVVRPRAGLFEKTVAAYAWPSIPEPVSWAFEAAAPPRQVSRGPRRLERQGDNAGAAGISLPRKAATSLPTSGTDGLELTFSTDTEPWHGDLGAFLRDRVQEGVAHARIRVVGSGPHRFSPVRLARGLWLEIRVEPFAAAEPPSWSPDPNATGPALIEQTGGTLVLTNFILRHDVSSRLEHLIHVEDGTLIVSRSQLTAPASSGEFAGNLIAFRSVSTQPRQSDFSRRLFAEPIDRPVCRLVDSVLITGGTALAIELGRGLVALSQCAVAAGGVAIDLLPSKVARHRFEADLCLNHCTVTSERSIIRFGPWRGRAPGPDRPWLVTSRNCAFLGLNERPLRETVLLRTDADALACGTVFWQAEDDTADVDYFTAAGDGLPTSNRARDVQHRWVQFWGQTHMRHIDGPRGPGSPPNLRFREKPGPGRVEPVNLILDPEYHPGRSQLTAGADLGRLGIKLPPRRTSGRARN